MSFSCFRPFGVWGVTFVFLDLQAHSFFAMFMLRSMCLCLDLCLFGPRVIPMFSSMCLCAPCHVYVLRSICSLLMPCAFCPSISLFPMFWPLLALCQITNHTLEKLNDWWRLHLPLVIP